MAWKIFGTVFLCALPILNGRTDRVVMPQQVAAPSGDELTTVKMFAFGGIGFAGSRSKAERAYYEIMSRPNRREILERVLEAGTLEGKCYALVGIYNLDRDRFRVLAAPFRSSKQQVATARGCILGSTTVGAIIERIEAGIYAHYV